jgi:hypothetical protein
MLNLEAFGEGIFIIMKAQWALGPLQIIRRCCALRHQGNQPQN